MLKYLSLIQNGVNNIQTCDVDLTRSLILLPAVPINESFLQYLNEASIVHKRGNKNANEIQHTLQTSNHGMESEDITSKDHGFTRDSMGHSSNTKGVFLTEMLSPQLTNQTQEGPDLSAVHLNYARSYEQNSEKTSTQQSTASRRPNLPIKPQKNATKPRKDATNSRLHNPQHQQQQLQQTRPHDHDQKHQEDKNEEADQGVKSRNKKKKVDKQLVQ